MKGINSITESGFESNLIQIECSASNSLPAIVIVGEANKSVLEAKERLRGAFAATKLNLPRKRITINLAPADILKTGTSLDLGMAAAILCLNSPSKTDLLSDCLIIGELSLDGKVRGVRGIIGKCLAAKKLGINKLIIPKGNLNQANMVHGLELLVINNLLELFNHLEDIQPLKVIRSGNSGFQPVILNNSYDISEVVGQTRAKRALEIAAAGQHNILINGPPGVGKSMLAKTLASILPPLDKDIALEITHIHSLSSNQYESIITSRPFRSPHHTASQAAILGGGTQPRPGEASLAHGGVLLLDELPEFKVNIIEGLRQPLEDKFITISRVKGSITYPANFILAATCNPCPCGFYGSLKTCNCSLNELRRYQKRLSGPILDRIDLQIDTDEVDHGAMLKKNSAETSSEVARRVTYARQIQLKRSEDPRQLNGELSNRALKKVASLTEAAVSLLNQAGNSLRLSARAYMRSIRVARTIADLAASQNIDESHIAEALQYRFKPLV